MMDVKLDKQQKADLVLAIRTYLNDEIEVEISGLQCEMLMEKLHSLVGPVFYNQGLRDAQAAILRRLDDAAGDIEVMERPFSVR